MFIIFRGCQWSVTNPSRKWKRLVQPPLKELVPRRMSSCIKLTTFLPGRSPRSQSVTLFCNEMMHFVKLANILRLGRLYFLNPPLDSGTRAVCWGCSTTWPCSGRPSPSPSSCARSSASEMMTRPEATSSPPSCLSQASSLCSKSSLDVACPLSRAGPSPSSCPPSPSSAWTSSSAPRVSWPGTPPTSPRSMTLRRRGEWMGILRIYTDNSLLL